MAEAIGVISGIAGLLVAAIQLSAAVSRQIDAIADVPRVLAVLSTDIKGFSSVLGTLRGYLDHEDTAKGVLHPSTARDLEVVLKDCLRGLRLLERKLEKYVSGRPGAKMGLWKRMKLSLNAKEFFEMREQLAVQKMTLNVSVTVANFINTTWHAEATSEMQRELCEMKANVSSLLLRLDTLHRQQDERTRAAGEPSAISRAAASVKSVVDQKTDSRPTTKLIKSKAPSATTYHTVLSHRHQSRYRRRDGPWRSFSGFSPGCFGARRRRNGKHRP